MVLQHTVCRRLVVSLAVIATLVFSFCPEHPAVAAQAAKKAAAAPAAAPADSSSGWQARIVGSEASPSRLIAVDKKQQTLFLFERHSPLRLAGQYACTTGQNDGDKFVQGDLKTPEGVYFVIRRIGAGLDFEKYGYEAYTLNYPNPVDKLRRKTGYGIWIHGRGSPISPNLTEGCVSLNNTDIAVLGKNLTPGTPVALAAAVQFAASPSTEDMSLINTLYKRTNDWAKAWSGKSKKFFDYYDADAYTVAQGESFSDFRQQKERVFKAVSFIDVKVKNVQALQGPGYWVTWFQQDYRASNLSTQGIRRLYWQKDKKGELRIVGMEWEPNLSGTLTAGLNGAPLFAENAKAEPIPEKPITVAAAAPAESVPAQLAKPAAPAPAPVQPAQPVAPAPQPVAAVPAPVAAPAPAAPKAPANEPVTMALAEMAKSAPPAAKPEPAKPEPVKPKIADVTAFIETWRKTWEKGDLNGYAACYAENAEQGGRTGAAAIRNHKAGLWRNSRPKQVVLTNIRITSKQGMVVADMHQAYTDSKSFADMGIKTLYLQAKGDSWRIVREDWSPMQQ
ncbi:exported hypothetical protein [uncultured delta proteobacterium]|uniref:L,D-TPase catalytic domain-containing protein n=1 Tax=uncultured delta proteobacterium TaxID=34034 RepID=A0A212K073_9DELT|nr:exported hypothetical protein [uncultured delta proteobacterium]